jgi:hypothetical protein
MPCHFLLGTIRCLRESVGVWSWQPFESTPCANGNLSDDSSLVMIDYMYSIHIDLLLWVESSIGVSQSWRQEVPVLVQYVTTPISDFADCKGKISASIGFSVSYSVLWIRTRYLFPGYG